MKANELRIGNYVTVDNEKYHPKLKSVVLLVQAIDYNRDTENKNTHSINLEHINQEENKYYESYAQFIKFINPIPLTEEWLVKFGFNNKGNKYTIDNSRIICHLKIDIKVSGSKYRLNHIKNVHQLQNLYFALTGEELTIEL